VLPPDQVRRLKSLIDEEQAEKKLQQISAPAVKQPAGK